MAPASRSTILTICFVCSVWLGTPGCGTVDQLLFFDRPVAAYVSPTAEECQVPNNADELATEVLQLINEERAAHDLSPVTLNDTLSAVAGRYACTLIQDDYFGHYHPETDEGPGERATEGGYHYRAVGENLAAGQKTPDEVMQDWMASENGHRENILNPMWEEVGVAIRLGGTYGVYWVQEFGAPWPALMP